MQKRWRRLPRSRKLEGFRRDAKNVRDSEAVILVGLRQNRSVGLNCGACGFKKCADFDKTEKKLGKDFEGPQCVFKCLDLGIALGSAAKIASLLNVDNRIMYRIGTAAMKLKMLQDATIIIGIPISASGKNIYFDRANSPLRTTPLFFHPFFQESNGCLNSTLSHALSQCF